MNQEIEQILRYHKLRPKRLRKNGFLCRILIPCHDQSSTGHGLAMLNSSLILTTGSQKEGKLKVRVLLTLRKKWAKNSEETQPHVCLAAEQKTTYLLIDTQNTLENTTPETRFYLKEYQHPHDRLERNSTTSD